MLGTPEERKRVGEELQRLRIEQHLSQEEVAEKAEMSIGSVQAIEYNKWDVGIAKIERYAAVFGTTADRLLNPEAVQPSDPKWRDLNDEHLGIARQYMKALKTVRAAVEALLQDDARALGTAASLAEIVLALKRILELKPGALVATQVILELDDLMVKLAERLEADPMFERALRELLETKTK